MPSGRAARREAEGKGSQEDGMRRRHERVPGDGGGRWIRRSAGLRGSGVEVVGHGLVELEVRNGLGLGGIECWALIEELDEEIALWRPAGGTKLARHSRSSTGVSSSSVRPLTSGLGKR